MAKQKERLIKARHFQHGETQLFPESHWRLVDKSVWIQVQDKAENSPLPEVLADIQQRAEIPKEQPEERHTTKRGRPAKNDTL